MSRGRAARPNREPEASRAVDPVHAWNALALVNDWVKHGEVKLGVVLAASGVSIGLLVNLATPLTDSNSATDVGAPVTVALGISCAFTLLSAGLAMVGLFPQVGSRSGKFEPPGNPLFFHDIAHSYRGRAPEYGEVLRALTSNGDSLVRHLAHQIHANADVARRKFFWADWAIRMLIVSLISIAIVGAWISLLE